MNTPETQSGGSLKPVGWAKAEIHFEIARAAMKLAARNEHGGAMAIEHLEKAIESLRAVMPNVPPELQPPLQSIRTAHDSRGGC
jgi:hypothetical protein